MYVVYVLTDLSLRVYVLTDISLHGCVYMCVLANRSVCVFVCLFMC